MRFTRKKKMFFFGLNPKFKLRVLRSKSKVIFPCVNRKTISEKTELNRKFIFRSEIKKTFSLFFSGFVFRFSLIFHGFKKGLYSEIGPIFWAVFGYLIFLNEKKIRFRRKKIIFKSAEKLSKFQVRYGIA